MQRAQTTTVSKYGRLKLEGVKLRLSQNTVAPKYEGLKMFRVSKYGCLKIRESQNTGVSSYGGLEIQGPNIRGSQIKRYTSDAISREIDIQSDVHIQP